MLVVTAVHTFIAEHGDELEFTAGEPIEVLERDDDFGDGWWRGRNTKGEEGLFPATYISETPIEPEAKPSASAPVQARSPTPPSPKAINHSPKPSHHSANEIAPDEPLPNGSNENGIVATAAAGLGAAAVGVTTVMGKTIGEIENAIESMTTSDPAPKHESEDEQELGIGSNARARLAAQAQLANEQRDKNRVSGGVAGLVYSDESDDEEEEERRTSIKNDLNKSPMTLSALQPAPLMPATPPLDKSIASEKPAATLSVRDGSTPTGPVLAWGVDEVVQWARSKGFEEASKFQEHEITGEILIELDANLLKELDIPQFGRRLKIAQAISELRRPSSISSSQRSPISQSLGRGMSAPPNTFMMPTSSPPPSTTPPLSADAYSNHSRKVSTNSTSLAPSMQPINETGVASTTSSVPPSPVTPSSTTKRESFGSMGHRKGKLSVDNKERLSFFGRSRKPAPSTPSSESRTATRNIVPQIHQMQPATPQETPVVSNAAALKQIGTPDHSGYMKKKGERYGWKPRFFVLKGAHLYYLASEHDRVKGHIPLQGHRVIVDENTNPGSYGFRLVGPTKTHYFSSSEQGAIRAWMKALMKATIARDYSVAVTSSCNIPTIPLAEAQALGPRPPSPASREATQRATRRENTNTLTAHDASILMSLDGPKRTSLTPSRPNKDMRRPSASNLNHPELVDWVNSVLPAQYPRAVSLPQSFISGEVIFLLIRSISGIEPQPPVPPAAFNPEKDGMPGVEGLFAMMDILVDAGVDTVGVTLNEVRSGDAGAIARLLESIRSWQQRYQ